MNAPMIRIEGRQTQTLTPRLQQAVRLLQLSSLEFAQELRDTLIKNPFLEEEDGGEAQKEEADAAQEPALTAAPAAPSAPVEEIESGDGTPVVEAEPAWEQQDSWQLNAPTERNGSMDSDVSAIEMVAADVGLRPYLHSQINLQPLSPRDRALVGCIIESLDDDGYLRIGLPELANMAEMDPAVDVSEMSMALKLVQSLEPSGVGARTVAECLTMQLHTVEEPNMRELARRIIEDHLERLAQRDLTSLARTLALPLAQVEAVCERIRRMDPRPGWRYGSTGVQFVTPDVIVKKHKGQWVTALNPAIIPRVRLNHMYADLFQRHRDAKHAELAAHLQEARWTVRNVEQRFSTILSVAEAILRRQGNFLEYGPLAMKPLGLREIAEEVGLHESTVSRVTNNKYMSTPVGVFELKYFFSRAMPTAGGGACSATAIRGVIKDMIDAEDPAQPLSDAEIARLLARQGLKVARRTVTKYRQQLRVQAVELRRQHV